jgi:hypothetical protein
MIDAKKLVPLSLSPKTTEKQNSFLKQRLNAALEQGVNKAVEHLDQQSMRAVLEADAALQIEISEAVVETVRRHTKSEKFKSEEISSKHAYPQAYRVRTIEAQVAELKKAFPSLGKCKESLAHRPLPDKAEDWFAIPRWQALAPTYGEAVEMAVNALAEKRRFSNRIAGRTKEAYLRQFERTQQAEAILAEQQSGNDILVVALQAGLLHRGNSARRTRVILANNEYPLGAFAVACLLLTHPERLSAGETLMIDCGGDEYSQNKDGVFDRVPLFDYDISGIEFSIYYDNRAWDTWGTPTAFLYKQD